MEPIKISASDLVKRSAMQICYLRNKKLQHKPSAQMMRGVEHQQKKSTSQFIEMRGMVKWNDDFLVYFCVDEVIEKKNKLIFKEHKNIEGQCEEWYINSSIIQTAFYHALGLEINHMCTAKFLRKEYETKYLTNISELSIESLLEMGDNMKFSVYPKDAEKIIAYYKQKAYCTTNYNDAKSWDLKNKFQDWKNLKKYIEYGKI